MGEAGYSVPLKSELMNSLPVHSEEDTGIGSRRQNLKLLYCVDCSTRKKEANRTI
jgi:hypothetical protein